MLEMKKKKKKEGGRKGGGRDWLRQIPETSP